MERAEIVLKRVNTYIDILRYGKINMEYLSRLNNLKSYYSGMRRESIEEVVTTSIECAEQLSGDLKLPLKVRGVFLLEGRPQAKYYTSEEMQKSIKNPMNKSFPLMLDHKDKEAASVIGMVDSIKFDPKINGIRWWGHINDERYARNVLDKAIKEVSATIWSVSDVDEEHGLIGTDLTFKELSLVMSGAVTGNYIEPY